MDVRLPNGRVIKNVPEGTTQEEIQQRAIQAGLATPRDFGASYLVEAARKGPASTAGLVMAPARALYDLLGMTGRELSQPGAGDRLLGSLSQGYQAGYAPVMQALGSTGAEPQDMGERILAGGVTAATSPLSYIFPPSATVRTAAPAARAALFPTEQAVIGAAAEAGGIAGRAAGEKLDYGGLGEFTGQVLGGAKGQALFGSAGRVGRSAKAITPKALEMGKRVIDKIRGVVPENEIMKEVDGRISNVFAAAVAADPNFEKVLTEAAKAQQGAQVKTPGAPAIQLPVTALLADNPVIVKALQEIASTNPEFAAKYGAQFQQAKDALQANKNTLFGNPVDASLGSVSPAEAAKTAQAAQKAVERRVRTLDEQIGDAYQKQEVDPQAFGQRIEKLLAQKEEAARNSTKPLYAEAFKVAQQNNVELPNTAVADIYDFVVGSRASDVFRTFKPIYDKVATRFRPSATEASPIVTEAGVSVRPASKQFSPATVEDLDSLKREINRQLRRAGDQSEIRQLMDLKDRVNQHIDELDPDFVAAYRNADRAYLERVGLPFNAATLKNVDRKKFVEQIAPAIIGNKSNVDDFLRVTGEDGLRVVKDAYYDSFSRAALKDGVIDPKAAEKWLAKNGSGMRAVPGLDQELRAATNDVSMLIDRREALNKQFREVTGNRIVTEKGFGTPQELVNRLYSSQDYTNKFMRQYGNDKDAVRAVRSYMLDDILNSADPIAALNDRTKASIFNRVFGPTYAKKVADMATTAARLKSDPSKIQFKLETVPKTKIEEITGVKPESIFSRFTNPVAGNLYAINSVISKLWAKRTGEKTAERMMEILLNPQDAAKIMRALKPNAKGEFDPAFIGQAADTMAKYGLNLAREVSTDTAAGAARGATQFVSQPPIEIFGGAEQEQ